MWAVFLTVETLAIFRKNCWVNSEWLRGLLSWKPARQWKLSHWTIVHLEIVQNSWWLALRYFQGNAKAQHFNKAECWDWKICKKISLITLHNSFIEKPIGFQWSLLAPPMQLVMYLSGKGNSLCDFCHDYPKTWQWYRYSCSQQSSPTSCLWLLICTSPPFSLQPVLIGLLPATLFLLWPHLTYMYDFIIRSHTLGSCSLLSKIIS